MDDIPIITVSAVIHLPPSTCNCNSIGLNYPGTVPYQTAVKLIDLKLSGCVCDGKTNVCGSWKDQRQYHCSSQCQRSSSTLGVRSCITTVKTARTVWFIQRLRCDGRKRCHFFRHILPTFCKSQCTSKSIPSLPVSLKLQHTNSYLLCVVFI